MIKIIADKPLKLPEIEGIIKNDDNTVIQITEIDFSLQKSIMNIIQDLARNQNVKIKIKYKEE